MRLVVKSMTTTADQCDSIIRPLWPVAEHIIAGTSTRQHGISTAPFDSLNLALHVEDNPQTVAHNRAQLAASAGLDPSNSHWQWLNQTHSTDVAVFNHAQSMAIDADASLSSTVNQVCAVLTADCLPVLLADAAGTRVAAIHAGWRGLANGIITNAVRAFCQPAPDGKPMAAKQIHAWLGPAIGPDHFEVGEDVVSAFNAHRELGAHSELGGHSDLNTHSALNAGYDAAFVRQDNGRYLADIYQLATIALIASGVHAIYGGGFCTVCETERFFSYRRDGITGRMASFIAIAQHNE